jgi:hypothetical protein
MKSKSEMQPVLLVIPKQKWSRPLFNKEEKIKYWIAHEGLKTDWMIEKRTTTDKPYVLVKICTGDRYGTFTYLDYAKIAAFLIDFG